MARLIFASLLVFALLPNEQPLPAAAPRDSGKSFTLRIYDYVDLEKGLLESSLKETRTIFQRFGLDVDWRSCPTSTADQRRNSACDAPLRGTDLVIRLLPPGMGAKLALPDGVFGFALPAGAGEHAAHATILFNRVAELAARSEADESFPGGAPVILGHVIAHEIGHLLLGRDSHASAGVMSFRWGARTLRKMRRGLLRFSSAERRRIREAIRLREASSTNGTTV